MNIANLIIKTFERPELSPAYIDADAQQTTRTDGRPKPCREVICA